ncbi:MAG: PIN domain-containing protein [Thermoleophilia bacterium]|nr:PIN domain-containing protein [Thermoleophilia bacterium]
MTWVLDASALLALVNDEAGSERVASAIEQGAVMSPVNVTEVAMVLQRNGWPRLHVEALVSELDVFVPAIDRSLALRAATFESTARKVGLSLGDRYCLATAADLDATALTSDQAWVQLDSALTSAPVELVR